MRKLKFLGATAVVSVLVATPAMAQQAVQEPGMQAFYSSLGVGSGERATASAMASANGQSVGTPATHHARASAKHYANSSK